MTSGRGLRLLIYDDTCRSEWKFAGLTHTWILGERLYKILNRFDDSRAVSSWAEAFNWLSHIRSDEWISEVQYWGHGKWGSARVGQDVFDIRAFESRHPLYPLIHAFGDRLRPESLFWFRTCETFGGLAGHRFAKACVSNWHCRVAGHTHIIGPWQSGLHILSPGEETTWSVTAGIKIGSALKPEKALLSMPWRENTRFCLSSHCEKKKG